MNSSPPSSLNGSPKSRHLRQYSHHLTQRVLPGSEQHFINVSDDEFSDEDRHPPPPVETGSLNKWTNMLHGWQERYFVLKDGVLSYYRSEEDVAQGCRGAIRLKNAQVQPHPYDDCRIDVR